MTGFLAELIPLASGACVEEQIESKDFNRLWPL